MKIVVVDDDKNWSKVLISYIDKFAEENGEEIEVISFENGLDFVSEYKADCDVAFLDVEMPLYDGLSAAKKIRESDTAVGIIFITNYSQYAINGYEVSAVDYAIKPLSYFAFCTKLKKALAFSRREEGKIIVIKSENTIVKLPVNKIYYIAVDKNYVIYYTEDGEYRERNTMKNVRQNLTGMNFANCNSGCLVNLRYVRKVKSGEAHVKDYVFPVSRPQKKEFMNKYIDYLSGGKS